MRSEPGVSTTTVCAQIPIRREKGVRVVTSPSQSAGA